MNPLTQQIHQELEKMKLEYDPECPFHFSDPRNDPTGTDAWNLAISDVQARLPDLVGKVVEEAELQGRRTGVGDCQKALEECITRVRTLPANERPDALTALASLKENK